MVIVIPKSHVAISNAAKFALGKDLKHFTIAKEHCPRTPEHRVCKQQISTGSIFAVCPTEGYKRFTIRCNNCKEELADIYAKDKTLNDWRRFRYKSWHDIKYWHGLRGANINPQTNRITLECSCEPNIIKTPDEFTIKETK